MKKLFLVIGTLVVVGIILTGATAAAALFGNAQKCPSTPSGRSGQVRSEQELTRLLETTGLTLTDAEATALAQKYLADKVEDPRVCFTPDLGHLSGNVKVGGLTPSFYVSTAIDMSGATPKTKDLDIRIGSVPGGFLLAPVNLIVENLINENLSKARSQEKFSVEFSQGSVTIRKVK